MIVCPLGIVFFSVAKSNASMFELFRGVGVPWVGVPRFSMPGTSFGAFVAVFVAAGFSLRSLRHLLRRYPPYNAAAPNAAPPSAMVEPIRILFAVLLIPPTTPASSASSSISF